MSYSIVRIVLWVIGILLALTLLVVLFYGYYTGLNQPATPATYFSFAQLIKLNTAFAEGMADLRSGNFSQAEVSFRQALTNANGVGEAQIKNMLATALADEANYTEAVRTLQDVAGDTAYSSEARAYALMTIGNLHEGYTDPIIKETTFNNPAYAQYVVPGNDDLTYANIFEAASALYPYDLSEVSVALLHADNLLGLYQGTSTVPEDFMTSEVALINDHLTLADHSATLSGPTNIDLEPEVFLKKAITLGYLARMHQGSATTTEAAFQQAQAQNIQLTGTSSGLVDFRYAQFLVAMYGKTRAVDIQNLLSDIYNGNASFYNGTQNYFINARNPGAQKVSIVKLATIDPKFKSFLTGLGWTAADFK